MTTLSYLDTIIKVTELFESKKRMAFVTYTRSSILSAIGELKGDKKPPKYFARSVLASLTNSDPAFLKAVQKSSVDSFTEGMNRVGLKDAKFYDASFLEHYIENKTEVFDIFMSHYLKNTKAVVVSFQYKSLIAKHFSKDSAFIHVPYNDFYDKIDNIVAQIKEFEPDYDLCVLDCPMFSSAVASKIWEKTNMSIFDLGKSLTVFRSVAKSKYQNHRNA